LIFDWSLPICNCRS